MMCTDETFCNKLIIGCKNNENPLKSLNCTKIQMPNTKKPQNYEFIVLRINHVGFSIFEDK